MSSARILLAAVASGLAACAHTPSSETSFYMPDLRTAAPVRVMDGTQLKGVDDHVVIVVDPAGIERVNRETRSDPFAQLYYLGALSGQGHGRRQSRLPTPITPSASASTTSTVSRQPAARSRTRSESIRSQSRR